MRIETGTFELRDNDMMMRELTYAETNEVAGGLGVAFVEAQVSSGANSSIMTSNGAFALATTNTTAAAAIVATFTGTGVNNRVFIESFASV